MSNFGQASQEQLTVAPPYQCASLWPIARSDGVTVELLDALGATP
jgi:hypothetical protein